MNKIILLAIILTSNSAMAQNLKPIEILKKAVEKAGGETWQNPETLTLKGNARFTPYGRVDSSSLYFDKYAMFRVYPKENDAAHKANGKIRFDAFEGENRFFQLNFDGKKSNIFLSDIAKPYEKHFSWSNNFGFSIIRFADKEGFKLERLADDLVDGKECYILQITDPKQMKTVYGIDKKEFYIRYLAFGTEIGFHHRIYSDFKKAKNVNFLQPTHLRIYFDGLKWMDINWVDFAVNQPINDEIFK
jgi:hypothetical protein